MQVPSVTTSGAAMAAVSAADLHGSADEVAPLPLSADETDGPAAVLDPAADARAIELFTDAVGLHTRKLLAISRAIVGTRAAPDDIVQQALTNLFQHRARYDWGNPAAAGALMRRAVVNESLRALRQPRMAAVAEEHPDARTSRHSPADPMINRELVARVRQAVDRLPEHFRAALVLCEYEGMAYVQIAEVLGCSIPQVKTWLHRARRQLASMLADVVNPDPPPRRTGG